MLQPHPIHDVLSHPAAIAQTELAGIMVFGRGLTAVLWEGLPTATAGAKIRQADAGVDSCLRICRDRRVFSILPCPKEISESVG